MASKTDVRALVRILQETKYAPQVFESLAKLKKLKPTTDVDRRRREINEEHGLSLQKEDVEDVFSEFQRLGLGKLDRKRGPGANSQFHWSTDIDYRVAATDAMLAAKDKRVAPTTSLKGESTYVMRLKSGAVLKLTPSDVADLREMLDAIS